MAENEERVGVRFPTETVAEMRRLAEKHRRSLNNEIVWAVLEYVESQRKGARRGQ